LIDPAKLHLTTALHAINHSMKHFCLPFFIFTFSLSNGQINPPLASPPARLQQRVGLTDFSVVYSRPAKRGRIIMGNLVPYGRIWRVGANESTKLSISDDITIEGYPIPKGTYALYAIPQKDEWTVIIHKNTSHWGDGRTNYDPAEDLVRFTVKPETIPYVQENLLIEFDGLNHNSANMVWLWENTKISFSIQVDTEKKMMEQINRQIKENPNADTYYQAARYLQEEGKMQQEALAWLEKAHALTGDKYYIHRVWSLVLEQTGDYRSAIIHAEKSKILAAGEGKDEFVRMNEASIQEWKKRLNQP